MGEFFVCFSRYDVRVLILHRDTGNIPADSSETKTINEVSSSMHRAESNSSILIASLMEYSIFLQSLQPMISVVN